MGMGSEGGEENGGWGSGEQRAFGWTRRAWPHQRPWITDRPPVLVFVMFVGVHASAALRAFAPLDFTGSMSSSSSHRLSLPIPSHLSPSCSSFYTVDYCCETLTHLHTYHQHHGQAKQYVALPQDRVNPFELSKAMRRAVFFLVYACVCIYACVCPPPLPLLTVCVRAPFVSTYQELVCHPN